MEETTQWLETNDFNSAPVYNAGQPVGYITDAILEDADDDLTLADVCVPLRVDVIIASDAQFDVLLDALYERRFYYLADRNQVTGVLTRADLNTEPVYQHLYTLLSRLEHKFRNSITKHAPDWQDTTNLHPDTLDGINDRHDKAKEADVALAPIHYAQFSTLKKVISSHEDCWKQFGFDSSHQASSRLAKIVDLRNDVAHSTPIIQNTKRGIGEAGRTITALQEQYELITDLLEMPE
ncbi:CBS domain-containing protein [Haloferax sp. DFSO52]|uniref:CBS domain-containing protein n=1 Tax=Haloferax sp. DFSO52 TaxID=3388505 RepID=UPI003A85590B